MKGAIQVDISQLFHISHMLGVSSEALSHNDQCPDAAQVGNNDVYHSLTNFFGNWKHKRLDLAERLQKLSQGVASAAVAYANLEKQLSDAFAPAPQGNAPGPHIGGNDFVPFPRRSLPGSPAPLIPPARPWRPPGQPEPLVPPARPWRPPGQPAPISYPTVQPPRVSPPAPAAPVHAHNAEFERGVDDLRNSFSSEWKAVRDGMDANNFAYNPNGNCTSYVAWRLNEVAKAEGLDWNFTNNHIGTVQVPVNGNRMGNALEWGNGATSAGFPPDHHPTVGSVAWWDGAAGKSSYGHVGVVRAVHSDGSIEVEESSWGSSVLTVKTYTSAQLPTGFLHLLPGT